MKNFLLNSKNIKRSTFFWNSFSSICNSFQTMILILVITRSGNLIDSSILAIAYAVSNLVLMIGKFGMRNFQVTDVNEKFAFSDYISSRIITGFCMLIAGFLYITFCLIRYNYSYQKYLCMLIVCFIKYIEAMEDVLHGRLQQEGRLDIAAKIFGIRMMLFIIISSFVYIFTGNLLLTITIGCIIMLVLAIWLNNIVIKSGYYLSISKDFKKIYMLLKECFPPAVSSFLIMYIGNSPKYIIDSIVNDETQTCFNVVFMPVFVITLLSSFIFNPIIRNIAEYWSQKRYNEFLSTIIKVIIFILVLTFSVIFVAYFIGIPILEFLYNVNLSDYHFLMWILLLSGGVLAAISFLNIIIVTVRRQRILIWTFGIITMVLWTCGKKILICTNLTILCIFYFINLLFLGVILFVFLIECCKKAKYDQ